MAHQLILWPSGLPLTPDLGVLVEEILASKTGRSCTKIIDTSWFINLTLVVSLPAYLLRPSEHQNRQYLRLECSTSGE